jgi:hypothetical protein
MDFILCLINLFVKFVHQNVLFVLTKLTAKVVVNSLSEMKQIHYALVLRDTLNPQQIENVKNVISVAKRAPIISHAKLVLTQKLDNKKIFQVYVFVNFVILK